MDDASRMAQHHLADLQFGLRYAGLVLRRKKACEPLHVQLNLATYRVDVINTTTAPHTGLTVRAKVYSLDNKLLLHREEKKGSGGGCGGECVPVGTGALHQELAW